MNKIMFTLLFLAFWARSYAQNTLEWLPTFVDRIEKTTDHVSSRVVNDDTGNTLPNVVVERMNALPHLLLGQSFTALAGTYEDPENLSVQVVDNFLQDDGVGGTSVVTQNNSTITVPTPAINDAIQPFDGEELVLIAGADSTIHIYFEGNSEDVIEMGMPITFISVFARDSLLLFYSPTTRSLQGIYFTHPGEVFFQIPGTDPLHEIYFVDEEVLSQEILLEGETLPMYQNPFEVDTTLHVIHDGVEWDVYLNPALYKELATEFTQLDHYWFTDAGLGAKDPYLGDEIFQIEVAAATNKMHLLDNMVFPAEVGAQSSVAKGQYLIYRVNTQRGYIEYLYRGLHPTDTLGITNGFLRTMRGTGEIWALQEDWSQGFLAVDVINPMTMEITMSFGGTEDGHWIGPYPGDPLATLGSVERNYTNDDGVMFYAHDVAKRDFNGNIIWSGVSPTNIGPNSVYHPGFDRGPFKDYSHTNGSWLYHFTQERKRGPWLRSDRNSTSPLVVGMRDEVNDTTYLLPSAMAQINALVDWVGQHAPEGWSNTFSSDSTAVFFAFNNNNSMVTGEFSYGVAILMHWHGGDSLSFSLIDTFPAGYSNARGNMYVFEIEGQKFAYVNASGHPFRSLYERNYAFVMYLVDDQFKNAGAFSTQRISMIGVDGIYRHLAGQYQASVMETSDFPSINPNDVSFEETTDAYIWRFNGTLSGEWYWQGSLDHPVTEPLVVPKSLVAGFNNLDNKPILLSGSFPNAISNDYIHGRHQLHAGVLSDYITTVTAETVLEQEEETFINVFPNPASTQLTLEMPRSPQVKVGVRSYYQIFTADGRLISDGHIEASDGFQTIDVSGLAAGSYELAIKGRRNAITFIKQ